MSIVSNNKKDYPILFHVLSLLIASMATFALNSGLWVRHLLIGGTPFRSGAKTQRLTMGSVQRKNPPHSIDGEVCLRGFSGADVRNIAKVALSGILTSKACHTTIRLHPKNRPFTFGMLSLMIRMSH